MCVIPYNVKISSSLYPEHCHPGEGRDLVTLLRGLPVFYILAQLKKAPPECGCWRRDPGLRRDDNAPFKK